MSTYLCLAALVLAVRASPLDAAVARDSCTACKPSGATGNPPAVGPDLAPMYVDLVNSVQGIHFSSSKRAEAGDLVERGSGFCCVDGSQCVKLDGLNIPMCYDKYTTNFAFADGSTGTVSSGAYSAQDGSKANLISGNFTNAGGGSGNLYGSAQAAPPNTATLSVPPQFTGTGSDSAIPISSLGSVVLITTTLPATTLASATTLSGSTLSVGSSAVSTVSAQTVTGPTTIGPVTAVETSRTAAPTKSKGAAPHVAADASVSLGMTVLTSLLCFVYAL